MATRASGAVRLHGYRISTWVRTVELTCMEKAVPYDLVALDRGGPWHMAAHPFLRMPVLEIDGLTLIETAAITAYIDETRPGAALQPAEPPDRARMRKWMSVCSDYLYRDLVRTVPRGRAATPDEAATARTALQRAEQLMADSRFLVGDRLTLADLHLAPQIANCHEKAPDLITERPRLHTWFDAIRKRPSFQATT